MKKVLISMVTFCCFGIVAISISGWSPVQKISTHPSNVNNNDFFPQITVDPSGNSYVTWGAPEGNELGIYWINVDAGGVPGTVQRVSTHPGSTDNFYLHPQIAIDPSGNSYVTWAAPEDNEWDVYWVKVDSSGLPGTVQKISTHPDNMNNDDRSPQIAVDSSGNSYITWHCGEHWGLEIYWVKVDSSGLPGTVQKISTHPDNIDDFDRYPQIATDSLGNSYIAWKGNFQSEFRTWTGVYWVKVDSSGVPGTVQKISTPLNDIDIDGFSPQISVDPFGNSYVTWWGHDEISTGIFWRKIDKNGTPEALQKVSTHPDNIHFSNSAPQIDIDPLGNSYITWFGGDGNDYEVYWVKVDSSGVPGTVQKVSTHLNNINNDDYLPQIAVDSSGNSYITWYGPDKADWGKADWDVYWVKVDSSGVPGTVQKVSTHPGNMKVNDVDPEIDVDPSGNSYITWGGYNGTEFDIYFISSIADSIGPVTSDISVKPKPPKCPTLLELKATVDDSTTGNSTIQAAEYFIDIVGEDGTGVTMAAQDGSFNSPKEKITAVIDVAGLSLGAHVIYVHGEDVVGNWGAFYSFSFDLSCTGTAEIQSEAINNQIRPLAEYNILKAEETFAIAQDLLSEAQIQNIDTEKCEELLEKAQDLLTKAQHCFRGGNYIAANIYALEAIEICEEVIELLGILLIQR